MAKNPENMTPEERLARIRSLERKVRIVENERDWAMRDEASVHRWAKEAWKEVRRLHTVCERHWEVRQEARRILGLSEEARTVAIAKFDYETRQWVPEHPELVPAAHQEAPNG